MPDEIAPAEAPQSAPTTATPIKRTAIHLQRKVRDADAEPETPVEQAPARPIQSNVTSVDTTGTAGAASGGVGGDENPGDADASGPMSGPMSGGRRW